MLGTVDLHKLIKSSNILAQERTLQRAKNSQVKQSTIVFLFSFITFFGELVEIENQAQKKQEEAILSSTCTWSHQAGMNDAAKQISTEGAAQNNKKKKTSFHKALVFATLVLSLGRMRLLFCYLAWQNKCTARHISWPQCCAAVFLINQRDISLQTDLSTAASLQ